MTSTDDSLVLQAQAGDRRAFEALVVKVARLIYSHVYLKTRDAHRSEDLVQETLLRAWKSLGSLDDVARFRPWVLSIADRVILDSVKHHSRLKRGGLVVVSEADPTTAHPGPPPGTIALQNEERNRVLSALESLPEEQRQVLMLRYLSGADYQTISKQLAMTNGSLRGLLQRGMESLKQKLKE